MGLRRYKGKSFDETDKCPMCGAPKERLQKCEYHSLTVHRRTGKVIFPGFTADGFICLECDHKWHAPYGLNLDVMLCKQWTSEQFREAQYYGEKKETWEPIK